MGSPYETGSKRVGSMAPGQQACPPHCSGCREARCAGAEVSPGAVQGIQGGPGLGAVEGPLASSGVEPVSGEPVGPGRSRGCRALGGDTFTVREQSRPSSCCLGTWSTGRTRAVRGAEEEAGSTRGLCPGLPGASLPLDTPGPTAGHSTPSPGPGRAGCWLRRPGEALLGEVALNPRSAGGQELGPQSGQLQRGVWQPTTLLPSTDMELWERGGR